ncbi:MAG: hypothetical protein KC457_26380, partial [Myxococcales bacterium]|nr:hypothetical protein [Myxococcales bacterium]
VDLSAPDQPPDLSDICRPLLREYYGHWSNQCYSLTPRHDGGLWLTAGHRFYDTAMVLGAGHNRIAVFEGSVDRAIEYSAEDGLLDHAELDEAGFRRQIGASAVAERDGVVYLAGELGISASHAGWVGPLVRFDAPFDEAASRSSWSTRGPREIALFADDPPSFALNVGQLAVVRITGAEATLRWPAKP